MELPTSRPVSQKTSPPTPALLHLLLLLTTGAFIEPLACADLLINGGKRRRQTDIMVQVSPSLSFQGFVI